MIRDQWLIRRTVPPCLFLKLSNVIINLTLIM